MMKPGLVSAIVVGAAGLVLGCGSYKSDYVPPKDGRARVVWDDDKTVAVMPEHANSTQCAVAMSDVQEEPARFRTYYYSSGPNIIIWRPWIVVHHHHHHTIGGLPGPGPVSPGNVVRTPATPSSGVKSGGGGGSIGSISGGGSSGGSSGGGGGGGDLGKAAVVLVVVALITLPIITLGLGLGRPEPSGEVADSIDEVNAFNDLARVPESPCMPAEAAP